MEVPDLDVTLTSHGGDHGAGLLALRVLEVGLEGGAGSQLLGSCTENGERLLSCHKSPFNTKSLVSHLLPARVVDALAPVLVVLLLEVLSELFLPLLEGERPDHDGRWVNLGFRLFVNNFNFCDGLGFLLRKQRDTKLERLLEAGQFRGRLQHSDSTVVQLTLFLPWEHFRATVQTMFVSHGADQVLVRVGVKTS